MQKAIVAVTICGLCFLPIACNQKSPSGLPAAYRETGLASYYADTLQGRKTASGERYNRNAFTAAHKTLPFGTRVQVTRLKTRQTITVRINDRGPFVRGRIIDLSYAAARELDMLRAGVVKVQVVAVD